MLSVAGVKEKFAMLTLAVVALLPVPARVCGEELFVRGLCPAATKASRVRSKTQNPVVLKEKESFFCISLVLLESMSETLVDAAVVKVAHRLSQAYGHFLCYEAITGPGYNIVVDNIRRRLTELLSSTLYHW
jgi:hypothetical protein